MCAVLCRGTVWPESVLEVLEKGLNALRSASGAGGAYMWLMRL
jgi:hypothetical protein